MKLLEVKIALEHLDKIAFKVQNGSEVPPHFHITEVGKISRHFIDCGGIERKEEKVNFQLWEANDYDHRLSPKKLLSIIKMAEETLGLDDLEVEVEYQAETIGKFGLSLDQNTFILINIQTECLSPEMCGINAEKPKSKLSNLVIQPSCPPGGNCC